MRNVLAKLFSLITHCCVAIVGLGILIDALTFLGVACDDPQCSELGKLIFGTVIWFVLGVLASFIADWLKPEAASTALVVSRPAPHAAAPSNCTALQKIEVDRCANF